MQKLLKNQLSFIIYVYYIKYCIFTEKLLIKFKKNNSNKKIAVNFKNNYILK